VQAVKWYRLAAAQGYAAAQSLLGLAYDVGRGVPQNYAEAEKWYRLAAAQSDATAQSLLGLMYDEGHGVPRNYAEAVKWYHLAAAQGNANGEYSLGRMYDLGQGVPKNYAEAVKWYHLAAAQGNALAQTNLGMMYYLGQEIPQNYTEAVKWLRLAAAQGETRAQFSLGLAYDFGRGVPQDYVQAHMWSNLCAANAVDPQVRNAAVHLRDDLASQMTPTQLADAQKLAREWKPTAPIQQAAVSVPRQPQSPPTRQTISGSGIFVSENGEILTNAHVVEGCRTAAVTAQGTAATARIIARDARIDLALLKLPLRSPATAQLRLTVRQGAYSPMAFRSRACSRQAGTSQPAP
jgi:TPR repeat protein